jgi:hypothetical protein
MQLPSSWRGRMSNAEGLHQGTVPAIGAVLRWPSGNARDWAERTFSTLCNDPEILAVVLFGSTIRPAKSSFDLDCLFIYRGQPPTLPPAPMEVDVRGYKADQVDELIRAGHDLLVWSVRLGKLVCERDEYWSRLTAYWGSRAPFPSPDVAEKRARDAERILADLREMGDEDAAVEQLVTVATHRARAALLRANVFPASRPELPTQLRNISENSLADALIHAMQMREALSRQYAGVIVNQAEDAA